MVDFKIIICTRNEESRIGLVLSSLKSENLLDSTIIVDGNSSDRTKEIVKQYNVQLIEDDGTGLAAARNEGLKLVNEPWVLYLGPDNLISLNAINSAIAEAESNNWIGISITSYYENKGYVKKSYNISKRARFSPGIKSIIGTPWLYKTKILKEFQFNSKVRFSDDTDLCFRLGKSEFKLGVAQQKCVELGNPTLKELKTRYRMYGISDSEYYVNNVSKNKPTLYLKFKSLIHPVRTELLNVLVSKEIGFLDKLYVLPFCLFVAYIRAKNYYTELIINYTK